MLQHQEETHPAADVLQRPQAEPTIVEGGESSAESNSSSAQEELMEISINNSSRSNVPLQEEEGHADQNDMTKTSPLHLVKGSIETTKPMQLMGLETKEKNEKSEAETDPTRQRETAISSQASSVNAQGNTTHPEHRSLVESPPHGTTLSQDPVVDHNKDQQDDDTREYNEFFSFPCNRSQLQQQKDHFFLFCRVLLKYLEHKGNGQERRETAAVMRQLGHLYRHTARQQGLHLILCMYRSLKASVDLNHWNNATAYCRMFVAKKRQQQQKAILQGGRRAGGPTLISEDDEDF